jgi:hypothetical protein
LAKIGYGLNAPKIDNSPFFRTMDFMETTTRKTLEATVDPQAMADMEEASRLLSEGKRITDPELLRRIRERADLVRDEAFHRFGVQEIGVEIIRELRDAG